jgi:hypothetical protein
MMMIDDVWEGLRGRSSVEESFIRAKTLNSRHVIFTHAGFSKCTQIVQSPML